MVSNSATAARSASADPVYSLNASAMRALPAALMVQGSFLPGLTARSTTSTMGWAAGVPPPPLIGPLGVLLHPTEQVLEVVRIEHEADDLIELLGPRVGVHRIARADGKLVPEGPVFAGQGLQLGAIHRLAANLVELGGEL